MVNKFDRWGEDDRVSLKGLVVLTLTFYLMGTSGRWHNRISPLICAQILVILLLLGITIFDSTFMLALMLLGLGALGFGRLPQQAAAPARHQRHRDADDGGQNEGADGGEDRHHQQGIDAGQAVPDQGECVHRFL